jgi:alpha-L-fucosidase
MCREKIPVAEYGNLAGRFNPVRFDAGEWVRAAQDAGMRYIVVTSKHHDGFAMFGSKTSRYNIVDATPFKRDPLKELAAAAGAAGIPLGFYYSHAQDWHHPGGAAVGGKWDPAQEGDFDEYLKNIAMPQVRELLTRYGPAFSIWFDTPAQMNAQRAARLAKLVHDTQPAAFINSRLLYPGREVPALDSARLEELKSIGVDYLSYADCQIPAHPQWRDWETCMTMNRSWGYAAKDNDWKPAALLTRQLTEVVRKGGNFLLNVGPTAEGVIPEVSVRILREVGAWLKANGESVCGTTPAPSGPES